MPAPATNGHLLRMDYIQPIMRFACVSAHVYCGVWAETRRAVMSEILVVINFFFCPVNFPHEWLSFSLQPFFFLSFQLSSLSLPSSSFHLMKHFLSEFFPICQSNYAWDFFLQKQDSHSCRTFPLQILNSSTKKVWRSTESHHFQHSFKQSLCWQANGLQSWPSQWICVVVLAFKMGSWHLCSLSTALQLHRRHLNTRVAITLKSHMQMKL